MDLSPYKLDMQAIPDRVEDALARGIRTDIEFPFSESHRIIEPGNIPIEDGVIRNPDGTLTVCCRTEMQGVSATMIDWWFCWHAPYSERYNLWHPKAHVRSFVREDRTHLAGQKAGYIGVASNVDEYIGEELNKLTITFKEPSVLGLDPERFAKSKVGTIICARAGLRDKPVDSGWLAHMIRETPDGVEMNSRFWLGNVDLRIPIIGRLMHNKVNSAKVRRKEAPDQFGVDLLRHCAEEMNHLGRFLPKLFRDVASIASSPEAA